MGGVGGRGGHTTDYDWVRGQYLEVVQLETRVACAHEAPKGVGAPAVLAEGPELVALVDVFQYDGPPVRLEPLTSRAHQVVLLGARLRAPSALGDAPGRPHRAAASRPGHALPFEDPAEPAREVEAAHVLPGPADVELGVAVAQPQVHASGA